MKKFLMIGLSVLCALTLVSCANKKAEEPAAGMINPWIDTDAAGLIEKTGLDLNVPEGAENVLFRVETELKLGEVRFTLNGVEYNARIKAAAEWEDISGMYFDWESTEDCKVSYCSGKVMTETADGETVKVCEWFDVVPGVMYSLSCSGSDLGEVDIVAVAEQVFKPLQGDAG